MAAVTAPEGFINLRPLSSEGHKKMVYVAFHTLTRSWKVLKQFREAPTEAAIQEDLRPLLARLEHPNIVRIDPPQVVQGSVWIIEEQLDGTFQDLAPLHDRYSYALLSLHIANALAYVHGLRPPIVHGDIHLRNCGVINGAGKLLDFGQATYDDPKRPRSGPHGYICTRSPEQFREHPPHASTRLDIWALGCTLYALRTGEYPFITPDELEQYREARASQDLESYAAARAVEEQLLTRASLALDSETPRRHRKLFDDEIWAVLTKCVQSEPDARPSATDLTQELQRYLVSSETRLGEAAVAPGAMAEQAREMINEHEVASLRWFEERVRAFESTGK